MHIIMMKDEKCAKSNFIECMWSLACSMCINMRLCTCWIVHLLEGGRPRSTMDCADLTELQSTLVA